MRLIWNTKFVLLNLFILAVLQVVLVAPNFQVATLLPGEVSFTAQQVISATNGFRSGLGLKALKENTILNIAAAQKLQDMALNEYFAHFSPSGVSPWHWFSINNYSYSYAGENLAIGFLDAQSTVDAWAQSPTHRKNMANINYQEIGVAVGRVKIQDTEGVLVVQLFGTPISVRDTSGVTTETPKPSPESGTSIGISIGQAQEPTFTPTPLRETPITISQAKEDVDLNDRAIPISINNSPRRIISSALLRTFAVYSLALALVAVVYLMAVEIRRELVMKTAIYVVLAVAAFLSVPVISSLGFIL